MRITIKGSALTVAILALMSAPCSAQYKVKIPLTSLGVDSASSGGGGSNTDGTGSFPDDDGDGIPNVVDTDSLGTWANDNDGDGIWDYRDPDQGGGADSNGDGISDNGVPPAGLAEWQGDISITSTDFQNYGIIDKGSPTKVATACSDSQNNCPSVTSASTGPATHQYTIDIGSNYPTAIVAGISSISSAPQNAQYVVFETVETNPELLWIPFSVSSGQFIHSDGANSGYSGDSKTSELSFVATSNRTVEIKAVGFSAIDPSLYVGGGFEPKSGYEINSSKPRGISFGRRHEIHAYEGFFIDWDGGER